MHLSVYLPFAFSALFGLAAPVLSRRQPPPAATWLLSVGSLMAAVGSTISLALLALTLVGQTPMLAARGHWSHTALRHPTRSRPRSPPLRSSHCSCSLHWCCSSQRGASPPCARRINCQPHCPRPPANLPSPTIPGHRPTPYPAARGASSSPAACYVASTPTNAAPCSPTSARI